MADDVAPAEQDKPIDSPEAPDTGQAQGEESFSDFDPSQIPEDADRDWFEQKYNELRSGFTQKTQEFGETRREADQLRQFRDALTNPQVAPAVLAQLGYDERKILDMYGYQPDEEPGEEPDLYEQVARLEGKLTAREQAEQQAQQAEAVTDFISGEIEKLEKKEDREFDAEEHQLLDAYARAYAKQAVDGRVIPDVEGAYRLLSGIYKSRQNQWIDSKKTGRPPGGGKPASRTVDLSKETPEERRARMLARAEEAEASQA